MYLDPQPWCKEMFSSSETWLKKSTVLTATHSLISSPSGSMTASRRLPAVHPHLTYMYCRYDTVVGSQYCQGRGYLTWPMNYRSKETKNKWLRRLWRIRVQVHFAYGRTANLWQCFFLSFRTRSLERRHNIARILPFNWEETRIEHN